ncbi:nucleoside hydrolase [Pseudorhizobium pelagicum]|uniref:Nucleoside hydrolase n=1 Tax=Pseudorhizobium pelagicum TaxID=1509405 RepID=A0A922P2T0_9HYPH|nr:nucleoside hydrolase [Pseudorhizobium pelagicum]KEQ08088.1 nucleoside hydrolase [Pseudorhizobium pelagicum]KEQ10285.1 nucleoside hydrolase [Pseudorhizobium pelagicum]
MHKVIFDTDPGIDDAMALLFLHRHPQIDLIGITTVFGNAPIDLTTRNALFLAQAWGISAPVAQGAGVTFDPSRPEGHWPTFIHGENGLGDVDIPPVIGRTVDDRPAWQFIIDTVRAQPGEVTLVAVGRMTNLALALKADPDFAALVKEVVVMGGAFDLNGNVSPAAEANIHGDPEAADVVFTAPWRVTVVGLDVTLKTVMTSGFLAEMAAAGGAPVQLLSDISQFYIDFYRHRVGDGMVVHDSCACVYLVAPELFKTRSGPVRVVCGGIADGQTIQKPDGRVFPAGHWDGHPSQLVCIDVEPERVLDIIRAAIVEGRAG